MEDIPDIELPPDWQEGVASFLAAFDETEVPSLDDILPNGLEGQQYAPLHPGVTESFIAGNGCPYIDASFSPSALLDRSTPKSPLDIKGNSCTSSKRLASGSSEASFEMEKRVDQAASSAEVKKRRLREKNRRAQQTYRNKQKRVMQNISSSVEELSLRVQQLEHEKADLETRNKMLRTVWRSSPLVLSQSAGSEYKPMAAAPDPLDLVRRFFVLVLPEEAHKLTTGNVTDITVDVFVRFWKAYCGKLRGFLEEGAQDPDSLPYKHLEELILAQRNHWTPFVPDDPDFAGLAKEAWGQVLRDAPGAPCRDLWIKVLHSLELSQEQKEQVLATYCQLLARCEELLQERQRILTSLQDSLPSYSEKLLVNPGLVYASHEAKRLAQNLEHEKLAVLTCKREFRCGILTPLQEARGIVASAPHPMDVRALCELVAEDEGKGDPG